MNPLMFHYNTCKRWRVLMRHYNGADVFSHSDVNELLYVSDITCEALNFPALTVISSSLACSLHNHFHIMSKKKKGQYGAVCVSISVEH